MKTEIRNAHVTQYNFTFEPGDALFGRCGWVKISLDHDNYKLSATSDCGEYSYTWKVTPTESFVSLMSRIDEDYLLRKISDTTVFKLEESKEETIENLKRYCSLGDEEFERMSEEIRNIRYWNALMFHREVGFITNQLLDYESISVVMDYPHHAKTFCNIFKEYLQPLLKQKKDPDICKITQEQPVKPCVFFRNIDECHCNNDPLDPGECIYECGIPHKESAIKCKYYK